MSPRCRWSKERRVIRLLLAVMVALVVSSGSVSTVGAQAPTAPAPQGSLEFPETGQWLAGAFKTYWEQHGGLAQFGYPISPPLRAPDGKTIQWLERARFEFHGNLPAGRRVLLGLLAREVTAARGAEAAFQRLPDTGDGSWFEQTGHTLRGGFRAHWEATGGLPVYGFPISEEFEEQNPADGKRYVVQYFERNRFEFHPEHSGTAFEIQLGLLGRQLYTGGGTVVNAVPDDLPPPPPLTVEEVERRVGPLRHRLPTAADLEQVGIAHTEFVESAKELNNGCLFIDRESKSMRGRVGVCPSTAAAQNYLNSIVVTVNLIGGAGRSLSGPWDAGVIAQRLWAYGPVSIAVGIVAFRQGTFVGEAGVSGLAPLNLDQAQTLAVIMARRR